eukprot:116957-Pleurochrysis_carterae.AAC.1
MARLLPPNPRVLANFIAGIDPARVWRVGARGGAACRAAATERRRRRRAQDSLRRRRCVLARDAREPQRVA